MPKGINMPPGIGVQGIGDDCITYGDTLTITFKEAGFFGSAPSGVFNPDLPMGLFVAGQTITATAPNTDKEVIMAFCDLGSHPGFYFEKLRIRSSCP